MIYDKKIMSMAIKEAYEGIEEAHGGPFGAVIVNGDEVLAAAHNTVLRDNDPTRHAEIKTISAAAGKRGTFDLSGCVIYTTTEPCPMCFSAIHWAKIDCVVYGTQIKDAQELGFNELCITSAKMKEIGTSPVNIHSGFMEDECKTLLKHWETLSDKKVY